MCFEVRSHGFQPEVKRGRTDRFLEFFVPENR